MCSGCDAYEQHEQERATVQIQPLDMPLGGDEQLPAPPEVVIISEDEVVVEDAQEFVEFVPTPVLSDEDRQLIQDYCDISGCEQDIVVAFVAHPELRASMVQRVQDDRDDLTSQYMNTSGRAEGDRATVRAWADMPQERAAMRQHVQETLARTPQPAPVQDDDEEEEKHTCVNCGEDYIRDDMTRVRRELWCDECYNDYWTTCASCDDHIHRDDVCGDGYCESCYEPPESECHECGDICADDDMRYDEEGDRYLCPPCYRDVDAGRWRHSYGTDVLDYLSFQGTPKDGAYYGIELEVEAGSTARVREIGKRTAEWFDGWAIMKKDGSLERGGETGFEIVTCPAPMEMHIEKFGAWIDEENPGKLGLRSYNTETCGMHVHISRKALTPLQLGKMVCFINNPLNRKFMVTIAQRDVDSRGIRTYAKFNGDKAHVVAGRIDDGERYNAVNLCNLHTVEIRIFKGTLNKRSLLKSLEFAHALVNYCRSGVVSIADSADYNTFIAWLGEPRQHAKYRNLISYLKDSGYPVVLRGKNATATSETVDGEFTCA